MTLPESQSFLSVDNKGKDINITPKFNAVLDPVTLKEGIYSSIKDDNTKSVLDSALDELKVDPNEKLSPPKTAWKRIGSHESILGTLGNFSLILGKAKSRKSFLINLALTCVLNRENKENSPIIGTLPIDKNKILYFDTEQGKYHVQLALKRISLKVKDDFMKDISVYHLRSKSPEERLKLIERAIYNTPNLGFVVIDGIKDLIKSINDEEEATMISSKLLKWTEEKHIHIVTVLHQNKSDLNARGHIGTELVNKAETVLSVSKNDKNKDISVVEAQQCRNREPEPFAFTIVENGTPEVISDWEQKSPGKSSGKNDLLDHLPIKQYEIVVKAFNGKDEIQGYNELVRQVKLAVKSILKVPYGDNKVKEFISHCRNQNFISQVKERAPYTINNYSDSSV